VAWTFTITNPDGVELTAVVRNAEFNDTLRGVRRQARGITDAGVVFVQDLDRLDDFLEASWGFLTSSERADLDAFFGEGGTLRMARPFELAISSSSYPTKIQAGMVVGGSIIQAGTTYKAGQFVNADTANLVGIYLDQDDVSFQQERDERFSLDLRFRIPRP